MAVITTILVLAFIAAIMYWPLLIRDRNKQEFVGAMYGIPILVVIVVAILLIARC